MKKRTTSLRKLRKGMTLLEVIVVLAIIALIGSLAAIALIPQLESSKRDAAKIDITSVIKALDIYYTSKGNFPSTQAGLQALVPQFLPKLPKDPWNNPYVYILEGGRPVVLSYGKDGTPGGEGNDADISSRDL